MCYGPVHGTQTRKPTSLACPQLLNSVAPPEDTEAAVPHAIKSHPKHFQLQVHLAVWTVTTV
jgi:hypothetical protein